MNRSIAPVDPLLPAVVEERASRRARLVQRVQGERDRLRRTLEILEARAAALTPAHQVRTSPIAWVVGAAVVGFALGVLTARR